MNYKDYFTVKPSWMVMYDKFPEESKIWFNGRGVDIGCGLVCHPNAIGVDLTNTPSQLFQSTYTKEVCKMNFEDDFSSIGNNFDFVLSSHSLEHFRDWKNALKRFISLIKKDGYLILIVPDSNHPPYNSKNCNVHFADIFPDELENEILNHGLKIVDKFPPQPWHEFGIIAQK